MNKLIQVCLLVTLFYAVVAAQESQSRLPVSMSFGYEHPTSSNAHSGENMEELPVISTAPVTSNQRSYESSYEDSEVPLTGIDEDSTDSQMSSSRTRSSDMAHRNYAQLNDESLTLAIKNTTGPHRFNETDETEPGSNSTMIKKKEKVTRVEELGTSRRPHPRNSTLHKNQDQKVTNITETEKITEEKNTDKNITNVTFPGGRGKKNETTENSAFAPTTGLHLLGFTAALVAFLNF